MPGVCSRWLGAAALAGLVALGATASADELVKFASAGRGDTIQGYLTRPKGAGPFPAVVLLHTCLGLPANRRSIADALAAGATWRCSSTTSRPAA